MRPRLAAATAGVYEPPLSNARPGRPVTTGGNAQLQVVERLQAVAAEPAGAGDAASEVQALLAAATRAYAALRGVDGELAAFAADASELGPTATDVVVTVSAMLESAGIELFEIGLWQTMGGVGTQPTVRRSDAS